MNNQHHRFLVHRLIHGMVILAALLAAGCGSLPLTPPPATALPSPTATLPPVFPGAAPLEALPVTPVTFQVQIPENTPEDEPEIYLSLRDEVTGLALNAQNYAMSLADSTDPNSLPTYSVTMTVTLGTTLEYRYERKTGDILLAEHTSSGVPVRYRIYQVQGPALVQDIAARWTDTDYEGVTGRVIGRAFDQETGEAVPDLLVSAGGVQTLTNSAGEFLLEGLPPGTHNLVGLAKDGAYSIFQQGALVQPFAATPAEISLVTARRVTVAFVTRLPAETPPLVPVRLAGNLTSLGNTFGTLSGGINGLAANMPVLTALGDGRHYLMLSLPVGADIRYKYTLGDGFWNSEHDAAGATVLRQVIVPDHDTYVDDVVETWRAGNQGPLSFEALAPESTPLGDSISIQFNPLFGWTEPLPMWPLGGNRWGYILFSPLPDQLSYRYCRNGQCGMADDAATPGFNQAGRPVTIRPEGQAFTDTIQAWSQWDPGWLVEGESAGAAPRAETFLAGVELAPEYHPSWRARLPNILDNIQGLGGNLVVVAPTWTVALQNPPVLEPVTGQDPTWQDLLGLVSQAKQREQEVAIFPTPRFPLALDEWWAGAERDYSWWLVWFSHNRDFNLHYADLAARSGAEILILGGEWVEPALPGGRLADGSDSNTLYEAEDEWRELFSEIRSRYAGKILWALSENQLASPPPFLDAVDGLYILWPAGLAAQAPGSQEELAQLAGNWLDERVKPVYDASQRPVVLAASLPSIGADSLTCTEDGACPAAAALQPLQPGLKAFSVDLEAQVSHYQAILEAVNQREWISGLVSRGYYPPAALQDASLSIHGKPAQELLRAWFSAWTASP